MNIADQLYYDFYTLLNGVLSNSFSMIVNQWQGTFIILATIAVVLIGYRQMFTSKPDIVEFFKHITVVIIVLVFVTNYDYMFSGLKYAFIDFPISAGNRTISGIQQGIAMIPGGSQTGFSSQDLSFEPTGSSTAFGAMWDFATTLADRVMAEAGIRNLRAYFVGGALYLVAILLLVFQILIMAIGLLLGSACILAAPVFVWMIMFKPLKPMFEKWLTMGVGAGILLFFLIVVMGIILAFMGNAVMNVMGYNIFTQDPSQLDSPTTPFNAKEFTATMLFMAIAIKLLPKTENWASALSAFSVHGVMQAANTMGGYISDALKGVGKQSGKLGWEAAKKTGDGANKAAAAAGAGIKSIRDRMMAKRMNDDPDLTGIEDKRTSTVDEDGIVTVRPDVKGDGFTMNPSGDHEAKDAEFTSHSKRRADTATNTDSTSQNVQQDNSEKRTDRPTINQNVNQNVNQNTASKDDVDTEKSRAPSGTTNRQETHASSAKDSVHKSSASGDQNRHDSSMSRVDREQNAATQRLRNEVKRIQQSGASNSQAQEQLSELHHAEVQRVSDNYSGAELAKLKKNIGKEFNRLHDSLAASKPMKPPKKADRIESKDLKDE